MTAGDWALLGLAGFAVAAVTVNLRLDFLGHLTDVRQTLRNPGSHTEPGLALDVAKRIQAQETDRLRLNQATQAMPPLVPTGIIRIWRDDRELIAVEGVAYGAFATLVVCRDPDRPDVWCVIHRPTGETIWTGYHDPEEALAGVARLSHVCDWTSPADVEQWKQLMREDVS